MSQPGLLWFLARLEEALQQGRAPDAGWLCRDRPEYLPFVQQALEQLGHLAPRLLPTTDTLVGQTATPATVPQAQTTLAGSSQTRHGEGAAPPSYELLDVLGRGGMGVVYRARQVSLGRAVALKMILAGSHAYPEEQARFLIEAETIAAIQHPGIVQVFEFGTHEGLPFLAMELCPGGSLSQKLTGSPLPPKEAAGLVAQIARAMQAAHDKGIVHRDLKPANVLLTADGSPRITDFGLAKRVENQSNLTHTGALLGTPSYMAPEQARSSKHTGAPADIYAMGAILYECLTGRPPFRGATPMETLQQVVSTEPVSVRNLQPKVPRDLETITHKALHKDPSRRYASAAALADDLDRFLAGEPVLARPVGPVERAWKWVKRRPGVSALLAAVVLSLVSGLAVSASFAYLARQRELLARRSEEQVREALAAAGRIAMLLATNVLAPIQPPELNREGVRSKGMSPEELSAIEDLAMLPVAIHRVELIRRMLRNPPTARKLSWRLRPVLRALLQLDLKDRQAALDLAVEHLAQEDADPIGRLVAARIYARLSGSEDGPARTAASILLDAVNGPLSPGERISSAEDLDHLALTLSPEMAAWLSEQLLGKVRVVHPPALELLANACLRADGHVPPARRRAPEMARVLVERLTRQAGENSGELALWHVLRAFAIVGVSLDKKEAQFAVARLVELAEKRNHPATVEAAAEVVHVLADRLGPERVCAANAGLAALALALVPTTSDPWLLEGLQRTLQRTLCSATGDEAARLGKPLADAITATEAPERLLALAEAFPAFAMLLPTGERSRLAGAYTDRLAPLLTGRGDRLMRGRVADAYALAAKVLDADAARQRLALARKLRDGIVEPQDLALAAVVSAALASRLPAAESGPIFARLNFALGTWLDRSPDAIALRELASALAAFAALEPVQGQILASRVVRRVVELIPATPEPERLQLLALALQQVARAAPPQEARRAADLLADRLFGIVHPESPLDQLRAMRRTMHAIRPWLDPARFDRICAEFAPILVRDLAQNKWLVDSKPILDSALAPLPIEELIALLKQPACIGPAENAAREVLNRRVGQSFPEIWGLIRWMSVNRPDVNLNIPLAVPTRHMTAE